MIRAFINIMEGAVLNIGEILNFLGEKPWALVSIIVGIFTKYIFGDMSLLPWLGIIVLADTISGYRAALFLHKQNPELYIKPTGEKLREKLAAKLTSYAIALVSLNAITNFEVDGKRAQDTLADIEIIGDLNLNFLKMIYYTAVIIFMLFELRSVNRNLKITGFNMLNSRSSDQLDKIIGKDGDTD